MQHVYASRSAVRSFLPPPVLLLIAVAFLLSFAAPALASDVGSGGGGTGLPWEGPIAKISQSVAGPIAFAFSLLGVIVCGAGLIWGGEIGDFMRKLIMLVLVISLIVFANTLLTGALFSGATIPTVLSAGPPCCAVLDPAAAGGS